MIELSLSSAKNYNEALALTMKVFSWFTSMIASFKAFSDIKIEGICTYKDPGNYKFASVIICDKEYHERILDILKQPPIEFHEKYIASVADVEDESHLHKTPLGKTDVNEGEEEEKKPDEEESVPMKES